MEILHEYCQALGRYVREHIPPANLPEATSALFSASIRVVAVDGTAMHRHVISDFELTNWSLDDTGVTNEIYVYGGVGHAFANPSSGNYAPEEMVDAWEKTSDFLNRYV